jgi:hypothetical protein
MEVGETVILVNSAPIHSCFYDVFNRHFAVIAIGSTDEGKKEKEGGDDKDDDDDNDNADDDFEYRNLIYLLFSYVFDY